MKTIFKTTLLLLATTLFFGCPSDDDAPPPVNEEEVITTLIAVFTPQGGGTNVTLTSRDDDGDGPNAPVVTVSGPFAINTTYNAAVSFLNELENPAEDITEEVEEESDEHQVFYNVTNSLGTFAYLDMDGNGNPLGVLFQFVTSGTAANGNMTITLRHEPDKNAPGVSDGDITNAGGETDIEETFPVVTQ